MAEKIFMVALSPTMESGIIARWNKNEGDHVVSGDILCEVETDKATMEYESAADGILLKIIVAEGEKAEVGETIAIVGEAGEDISAILEELKSEKKPAVKGEKQGAKKTSVLEKPSPAEETVLEQPEPAVVFREGKIKASPLAKEIAREKGIDLQAISGSGPGGRIIKRDVEQAVQAKPAAVQEKRAVPAEETIRVSGKRKVIAERLSASLFSAPHYYLKVSVLVDNLIRAREKLTARMNEKISFNAFLMKLCAETLKNHPMINATWKDDTIVKHGSIDIGLAVALPDGLITPVVRDCARKDIRAINRELTALIEKAKSNSLKQDEYSGATFTVSNLGSYGIEEFTAIINPPGSAILAVGMIKKEPVVVAEDSIAVHSVLKLTLSCDHRVIDGAVGAAFLSDLKDMIEYPVYTLV